MRSRIWSSSQTGKPRATRVQRMSRMEVHFKKLGSLRERMRRELAYVRHFGSLTGGYEFRDKNSLVSPYGRLDFASNHLNTSTETGTGFLIPQAERRNSVSSVIAGQRLLRAPAPARSYLRSRASSRLWQPRVIRRPDR